MLLVHRMSSPVSRQGLVESRLLTRCVLGQSTWQVTSVFKAVDSELTFFRRTNTLASLEIIRNRTTLLCFKNFFSLIDIELVALRT